MSLCKIFLNLVVKLVQFLIWTKLYPNELPPFQARADVLLWRLEPSFHLAAGIYFL